MTPSCKTSSTRPRTRLSPQERRQAILAPADAASETAHLIYRWPMLLKRPAFRGIWSITTLRTMNRFLKRSSLPKVRFWPRAPLK